MKRKKTDYRFCLTYGLTEFTDHGSLLAGLHHPCVLLPSSLFRSRGVCSLTAFRNGVGGGGVQQEGAEMFGGFFLI